MNAALKHDDLFRYGPEAQAEPVASGIKQIVLGANAEMVQSKSWFEQGAVIESQANRRTLVSYVLDGFFEVQVDAKSQILGPGGAFIVPKGAGHVITCLEDGVLLGVFASEECNEVLAGVNHDRRA